jgi:hypothetical protein
MRYLYLLYVAEESMPAPGTVEFDAMVAANVAANRAMGEAGVLVGSAPLHPVRSTRTVQVRDGDTLVTDGPFAELKEQLGGYYLLECADLAEALRWAEVIPAAHYGSVEVRPVLTVEAAR